MACLLNSGYSLGGCRDNIGGIRKIYIANYNSDQEFVLDGDNNITALTVTSPPDVYYVFDQEVEVGAFNQEGQYSTEAGTIFFVQTLEMTMYKNDAEMRNRLLVLSQSQLSVIIEDQRGNHWLMGKNNACRVVAGSQMTGKSFGDLNGVTITIEGREPEPAHRIEDFASIITTSV